MHISIDVETTSLVDLKKWGAWKYSRDPSTRVIVISWSINGGPIKSAVNVSELPLEVIAAINAGAIIHAWNAAFEYAILTNIFGVNIQPDRISCTMARSLYAGGPGSLDAAGPAFGLSITKDKQGHALMMRMSRPRTTEPLTWWHEDDPQRLERLRLYCEQDVRTEMAVSEILPPLPKFEQQIYELDHRANTHGMQLDLDLLTAMRAIADESSRDLNAEISQLTSRACTNAGSQVAKLQQWLGSYAPPSLSAGDVATALGRTDLPDDIRRAFEIRQEAAKSSTKKLDAMRAVADDKGVVRGLLQYSGAGRTHRFAGRLIQIQNLPRPAIKKVRNAIDDMLAGMHCDGLRAFYGDPLTVISSCLRGVFIPRKGKKIVVYDLSAIEGRVVAWLAGQKDILRVFKDGGDVYVHTQKKLGLNSRQEGKVAVLGLNYGMGPSKFIATAEGYGLTYDEEQATKIVADYRAANNKIAALWKAVGNACIRTVDAASKSEDGRAILRINALLQVSVVPARNGLPLMLIHLPAGGHLFYRNVRIEEGDKGQELRFDGVDQKTRQWGMQRTYGAKLVENITQSVARDILCDQLLRIEAANVGNILATVHDEVILECDEHDATRANAVVHSAMNTAPLWARDCPVGAEGGVLDRYGK